MKYTFKRRKKKVNYRVQTPWNECNNPKGIRMTPLYWEGKYDKLPCHSISDRHVIR